MTGRPPCLCTNKPGVRCDAQHCDRIERGRPFVAGQHCPICWLFHHDRQVNLAYGGDGAVATVEHGPRLDAVRQLAEVYITVARHPTADFGYLAGLEYRTIRLPNKAPGVFAARTPANPAHGLPELTWQLLAADDAAECRLKVIGAGVSVRPQPDGRSLDPLCLVFADAFLRSPGGGSGNAWLIVTD